MRTKSIPINGDVYLVAKPTLGQLRDYRESVQEAGKVTDSVAKVFALEDASLVFVCGCLARAGAADAKAQMRGMEPEDFDALFAEILKFSGAREKGEVAEGEAESP